MDKPPYGSPCNNCGLCCQNEVCPLGKIVFGGEVSAPCPALESADGLFVCGLIARPNVYQPVRTAVHGVEAMRDAAILGIGAGIGCDARLDSEGDALPPYEYAVALEKLLQRMSARTRARILRLWSNTR